MCDKKNYVLFTDTECLVLSLNFKLPDENQILLKIPRKDNMYSFDMKNIVPKESLTCLVANATLDESMPWQKRTWKQHRASWVFFLTTKDETSEILKNFIKEIENLVDKKVKIIRSDNGTEFKNKVMDDFCREKSIKREYGVARTPIGKHGVEDGPNNENAEQERFADDSSTKDVNAARQHVNTASTDVNTGSLKLNVVGPSVNTASSNEHDSPEDIDEDEPEVNLGNITNPYTVPTTLNTRIHKDHPIDNVIGDVKSSVQTRRMTKPTSEQGFLSDVYEQKTNDTLNTCLYAYFLSQIKPTSIAKALYDSSWVKTMQEELLPFKLQQVWILVDLPSGKRAIGTKWVFRNKKDEMGIVIRNKASLLQPVDLEKPLVKDEDADDVDVHLYISMIGSLMYIFSKPILNFISILDGSLEGLGDFSIASVRKLLDGNMLPEVASKTRWIKAMPIKVNVHVWRVKLDCLPTRINIFRRGMEIESIICPMCGEAAESSKHIFFRCHIAREILRKISRWDGCYMGGCLRMKSEFRLDFEHWNFG
ncbi:putative ribonuclease H-like domain-containing protein [Tanacetum coccineum]